MSKKNIVLLFMLILFTSVLTVIILLGKNKVLSGDITMVVSQSKNGEGFFNRNIMNLFNSLNEVETQVIASPEKNYIDYIGSGLGSDRKEDIYYTTFSSQVYSFNMGYELTSFSKEISDELPSIFYTLSMDNDSYFYIPVTWSPWGVYYNKSVFSELGLEEPKTLNDLEQLVVKLLENNITPYSMMRKVKWPMTAWFDYINIRKNGAGFHNNLLAGRISFHDERVLEVYQEIYRMIENNYFFDSDKYEWTDMLSQLEIGDTAMILGGAFFFDHASPELKENMGWFSYPVNNKAESYDEIVTTSGYIINGNISDRDIKAAEEYLSFSHSTKAQKLILANTDFYPVNKEVLADIEREDLNKAFGHVSRASRVIPSFERNNNPALHLYFKVSISMLFDIENALQIPDILDKIENERLKL